MEEKFVPREWREKAEKFQYNLIAPLFALNLNLNAPPKYKAAENNPDLDKAFMVILGLENFKQYPEIIPEIKTIIEERWEHETAAFRSRAKNFLKGNLGKGSDP